MTWTSPPTWPIPHEWDGDRCFVLCSGESLGPQRETIRALRGRFVAVKHGLLARPDADVLFLAGEGTPSIALELIPKFRGKYMIVRGRSDPALPADVKRVSRAKNHGALCELRDHVCGRDAGTSAINAAYHLGSREIVMCGYDMRGGHFCKHPLQFPPVDHFTRHMEFVEALAADAKAKGVRILNASPISAVTAFERVRLEDFL